MKISKTKLYRVDYKGTKSLLFRRKYIMNLINRIGEELGFAFNFCEGWIVVNVLIGSNCKFIYP